jgi:hypothetical protein
MRNLELVSRLHVQYLSVLGMVHIPSTAAHRVWEVDVVGWVVEGTCFDIAVYELLLLERRRLVAGIGGRYISLGFWEACCREEERRPGENATHRMY